MILRRKACKYHITNLLIVLVFHPARIRSVEDFLRLSEQEQGVWYEWLVAQELLRRTSIVGEHILEPMAFWQNKEHEVDFVVTPSEYVEVKRGKSSPLQHAWFPKPFPKSGLAVVNQLKFTTDAMRGGTLEEFLLGGE